MNVPKLRFREFNDEWKKERFYSCVSITNGQVNPKDPKYCNLPHIGPGNIEKETGRLLDYNLAIDDKLISNKYLFDEKDIIYSKINPHFAKVCYPKFIGLCSADAYPIKPKDNKLISGFLLYLLLNPKFTKFATSVSMRTGMPKINRDELGLYKFNIPSIKEQAEISDFLQLLDKKIELQYKKIEALKLYKKGLINREFSSSNLEEISIRELGKIITGTTPSRKNNLYWESGNIVWITPTDITYYKDINSSINLLTLEGLKKGKFIPKNSILITCIASIGKNAKLLVDGSCNQQINAIIPDKQYNSDYIYYLMEYMEPYFKSIAGTTATSIINKETFENVKINIHSYEKREFIGNYLNYFENKILLEDLKIKKLIQLKKGLMQNMFV